MTKENLTSKLAENKRVLAIVIGLSVTAVLVSISIPSIIAQSNDNTWPSGWKSNFTHPMMEKPTIEGSVNVKDSVISSVKVKFSEAADAAATSVEGSTVVGGRLVVEQNYLVYKFGVLDSKNQVHAVIVDAGDGKVLYTSEGFDMDIQTLLGSSSWGPWSMGGFQMHDFHH